MADKELKSSPNANAGEEPEGRRSFMKGIVAGTVAAGTIASTVANARPAQFAAATNGATVLIKPRPETAKLKITFDQKKPPKLYEVQKALEDLARRLGCEFCGFGGIDVLIRLDEIINPADRYVAVVEGSIG